MQLPVPLFYMLGNGWQKKKKEDKRFCLSVKSGEDSNWKSTREFELFCLKQSKSGKRGSTDLKYCSFTWWLLYIMCLNRTQVVLECFKTKVKHIQKPQRRLVERGKGKGRNCCGLPLKTTSTPPFNISIMIIPQWESPSDTYGHLLLSWGLHGA